MPSRPVGRVDSPYGEDGWGFKIVTKCKTRCPDQKAEWDGIRAICFDAGDTLVLDRPSMQERVELALIATSVSYDSANFDQAFRRMIAFSLDSYLHGVALDDPALLSGATRCLLAELGVDDPSSELVNSVAAAYSALRYDRILAPGAVDLLTALRARGFKIAVISDWEPDLPNLLDALGCDGLLDCVSVSSVVGVTKPDPHLFRDALARMQIAPDQAVHVGDYLELDIAGARDAGMHSILFDWKQQYNEDSAGVPVVRSFDELAAKLLSLQGPN